MKEVEWLWHRNDFDSLEIAVQLQSYLNSPLLDQRQLHLACRRHERICRRRSHSKSIGQQQIREGLVSEAAILSGQNYPACQWEVDWLGSLCRAVWHQSILLAGKTPVSLFPQPIRSRACTYCAVHASAGALCLLVQRKHLITCLSAISFGWIGLE